jgi:large subunit ribosomal protein L7/L12
MAELKRDDVLQYLETATMLEISGLIKDIEEKFGVTAAAPAAVAAGPVAAGAVEAEEEQTEFDIILTAIGDKKIQVIKVVRAITSLGLKEAKELVDSYPKAIKEGITKAEAEDIQKQIEEVGGQVDIK